MVRFALWLLRFDRSIFVLVHGGGEESVETAFKTSYPNSRGTAKHASHRIIIIHRRAGV